jgi:hypothetical protein
VESPLPLIQAVALGMLQEAVPEEPLDDVVRAGLVPCLVPS